MYYYFLSGLFYEKDIHKIIYLDIDTVIQKDLTTFYEFKFSKIFCAMKCNVIIPYIQHQNSVKTLIGEEALEKIAVKFSHFITNQIGKYDNYSNSGVLLINLELLRTINLDDLFKIAHEKKFNDQDLLSYYFWNQLDNFDIKYNFCIHFFTDEIVVKQLKLNNITMDNLNNFLDFAHVVHVSIRPKPTFFFNFKYSRLINKYGNIQNFINVISKPDFYIEKYSIHLAESEKEEITTLNKT
jgi:lipopolysaccharide biosynthesis glycosyltransferase